MAIGVITGSGTYALPGFSDPQPGLVDTPFGDVPVTRGTINGVDIVHVSRHLPGHIRLSNHVNHRGNAYALKQEGVSAVVGCTACGACDTTVGLGDLIVFDDLHFPSNRLPDGSLATVFTEEGDPDRAHWILHGGPFSEGVRTALVEGASETGHAHRDGGTYGNVDGPRFNTPSEIAQLAAAGVTAVSQTGGPETVLCGELELPYALMGYATDYANEIQPGEPTPADHMLELMSRSTAIFAAVLAAALPRIAATPPAPAGIVYRFGS